jgi:hypothetical protein
VLPVHCRGVAAVQAAGSTIAGMSNSISPQHPAVVLRSHYVHLRTLLAVAMIAVVALTAAVVVLATQEDSAPAAPTSTISHGTTRYDGGPEEGTRGPTAVNPAR